MFETRRKFTGERSLVKRAGQLVAMLLVPMLLIVVLGVFSITSRQTSAGQPFDYVAFRSEQDAVHLKALNELAEKCEANGLSEQAAVTRSWFIPRDPKRQHIFLPANSDPHQPAADVEKRKQQWHRAFRGLRSRQAAWLFDQARTYQFMNPSLSFQLLHETLHENPDHEQARAMLGYDRDGADDNRPGDSTVWIKREKTIRARKAKFRSGAVPKGLLWQAESAHFRIITTGEKESAIEIAEKFERWYDVWQQLFVDFWMQPRQLEKMFAGDEVNERARRHTVIVYESRQEYVERLAELMPGIEVSSGYYNDKLKQSFFFGGEEADESTWRHELTHQLFQELVRVRRHARAASPAEEHGVWALEGIAMYMESLRDFGSFVTVGGFESPRLQYARLGRFRMGYKAVPEQIMQLGLKPFQARDDIATLYPVCAGYCHFLMDAQHGRYRDSLRTYINELYSGESTATGMLEKLQLDSERFDAEYAKFLYVSPDDINRYLRRPEDLTVLSLVPSNTGDAEIRLLSAATNLQLLDLTGTQITDAAGDELAKLPNLTQLFLEGTRISDGTSARIAGLTKLQELDLSRCPITNKSVTHLAELPALKVLWLSRTAIDSGALADLGKMKTLQQLEISGTGITEPDRKTLLEQLPDIQSR